MKRLVVISLLVLLVLSPAFSQTPVNLYGRGATGENGVVAAAKPEASQVGVDILRKGGNAVDAAVAVGFALGVLEPNASGLGGGGFMLIKLADMREAVVVDFREKAPAAARPDMFRLDSDGNVIGRTNILTGLASGVPGEVAGLLTALEEYGSGRLSRADVMQPAIDYAVNGYRVTENLSPIIASNLSKINDYPATAEIYTDDGLPPEVGSIIRNPDLANTLRQISRSGRNAFYRGRLARQIAEGVQAAGGIITVEDLADYEVEIREPITGTYRGYDIISTPPASSGGTIVIEILNILENIDMASLGIGTTEAAHVWIEAMRLGFADRGAYMADADFVDVPLEGLTSKEFARRRFEEIDMNRAMGRAESEDPSRYESGSTTSYAVMDDAGNVVAVTKSINYFFGSGLTIPGTGILMNNHMGDFVARPGHIQSVEPEKRPLSSMTPTLVLDERHRPFMAVGSPGATRIIGAVAQTISNVVDLDMPIQDAVMAPRVFAMASGDAQLEGRISINTMNGLIDLGHDVNVRNDWDAYFGGVHAVLFDHDEGILRGGADPRRDGQAVGF
ncbi:MAG: gamma-glutamyltransferase [Alkalispirochaeta sp.]